VTVQAYGDYTRTVFSHFDTGVGTVSFSFADQDKLSNPIPTKTPHGGAVARGIGGPVTGDVSNAGKILADGMHAVSILYGPWGYPVISINFSSSAANTPGVQAFIGTDTGSVDLPTLTGTPILNPSTSNPNGLAALIDIKGITLDFSFLESGLFVPVSDLTFVAPGTSLAAESGTTNPVRVPLISFGGDNHLNPGEKVTESYSSLQPEVALSNGNVSLNHQHFLLDTGAQMSVISTAEAQALGLDLNHPTTSITVQGVAGEAQQVPGFTIDELKLPLADGGTLSFTHVPIYVLDLANNLDGLLGMNLFNSAASMLYDPFGSAGSSLQLTFFTNPDRNLGNLNQGSWMCCATGDLPFSLRRWAVNLSPPTCSPDPPN
jgi:hypothetical protein